MGRDHHAAGEVTCDWRSASTTDALDGDPQNWPSRASKWVGLLRVGPPRLTQWATQSIILSSDVRGGPKRA